MLSRRDVLRALTASVLVVHAWTIPVRAQNTDDFYKGKSIRLLIGFGPGGGYDLYARTLARHMGRHIPGNPTIVPQNMPGAGSLLVANHLANAAPRDGTVIGAFASGIPSVPLLTPD